MKKAQLINRFDHPPERRGSHAIKWEKNLSKFGREDLIPLWIADMDFASPQAVSDALIERASHGVFGYSYRTPGYFSAVQDWLALRFGWQVEKKALLFYPPGTVSALNMLVNLLTEPGDEIVVQTPSYPPLMKVVERNERRLLKNPLRLTDAGYQMDLAQLEATVSDRTRLMLLCSPHNPTGRVWRRDELVALAQICKRRNITIISDEVHSDLILWNTTHTHFNRLDQTERPEAVTIISSCKTFNLAGLPQATLICDSARLKLAIQKQIDKAQLNLDGVLNAVATEVAYREGKEWLQALMEYLQQNRNWLQQFIDRHLPGVKLVPAEGTYLAWLDFRALGIGNRALQKILIETAGVGLYDGTEFGDGGEGFFRLNFACSRHLLEAAMNQIAAALETSLSS